MINFLSTWFTHRGRCGGKAAHVAKVPGSDHCGKFHRKWGTRNSYKSTGSEAAGRGFHFRCWPRVFGGVWERDSFKPLLNQNEELINHCVVHGPENSETWKKRSLAKEDFWGFISESIQSFWTREPPVTSWLQGWVRNIFYIFVQCIAFLFADLFTEGTGPLFL